MGDERGVVSTLTALLFVGIAIAIFCFFYPSYVHARSFEAEAEHMESVRESLLEIKSAVEGMSEGDTLSFEVQMSAEPVPLVLGSGVTGVLSVVQASDEIYGALEFSAWNQYYPSQTYVLEGGGVIVVQEGAAAMISSPAMITAWDLGNENIRVNIDHLVIIGDDSWAAKTGTGTVEITCVSSRYEVAPEDGPNRGEVVVNLENRIRPGHEQAWSRYLKEVAEKFHDFNTEFTDDLELTIRGKRTGTENDIYCYERVREIRIKII